MLQLLLKLCLLIMKIVLEDKVLCIVILGLKWKNRMLFGLIQKIRMKHFVLILMEIFMCLVLILKLMLLKKLMKEILKI